MSSVPRRCAIIGVIVRHRMCDAGTPIWAQRAALHNSQARKQDRNEFVPHFSISFHRNLLCSTASAQKCRALPLRSHRHSCKVLSSQSARMFSDALPTVFSVAGDSLEGESPGESGSCPVSWCPGVAASSPALLLRQGRAAGHCSGCALVIV